MPITLFRANIPLMRHLAMDPTLGWKDLAQGEVERGLAVLQLQREVPSLRGLSEFPREYGIHQRALDVLTAGRGGRLTAGCGQDCPPYWASARDQTSTSHPPITISAAVKPTQIPLTPHPSGKHSAQQSGMPTSQ